METVSYADTRTTSNFTKYLRVFSGEIAVFYHILTDTTGFYAVISGNFGRVFTGKHQLGTSTQHFAVFNTAVGLIIRNDYARMPRPRRTPGSPVA